ncbi:DNA cytosine methyltransferase [Opitutaceae bacterium TAV4]|nr:DNA cytosine methyltransferase [Opitutaceae bacterium TAV4]RRK00026.1 DNA cytosine methyltransferase [Opitutaceae bacterium TAV3]
MSTLTCIDLFAGCGGLSTGLHLAGWQGLFAIERNASAFLTLKSNLIDKKAHFDWPDWLPQTHWDIKQLLRLKSVNLAQMCNKVDLVAGGPPCQGFSMAGRRREADERNKLIFSYLKVVKLIRPRIIMFENVRGFTMKFQSNSETEETYAHQVIERLKELGYSDARGKIIDMSSYGIPQQRHRFIVIATQTGSADSIFTILDEQRPAFLAQKNIPERNTAADAISDLEKKNGLVDCPDSRHFTSGVTFSPLTKFQRYIRDNHSNHTPDSHRFVNHTPKVEKVFQKMLIKAPRNKTIAGDDRIQYGLKKRSAKVLDANQPTPTITTIPDDLIHYREPRVMTVRECARLQTFPDWFTFKGPYTTGGDRRAHEAPRYTQVGNAVPPLFAEQIGRAIKKVLQYG